MVFHSLFEIVEAVKTGKLNSSEFYLIVDNDEVYLHSSGEDPPEHEIKMDEDPQRALIHLLKDLGINAVLP
jgi:tmRNA-binding protein